MSIQLTNNLNFNQNQAENLVLQNLLGVPSNPVPGQIYYDTTGAKQRAYYYSPTGNAGNPGWILIDQVADTDNYVDAVSFNAGTLTLGRTGSLPDLSVNLNGTYLPVNQTFTLTGEVTGSGQAGNIVTTLHPSAITNQPDALVSLVGSLESPDYFLVHQNGDLAKYSWGVFEDYINNIVNGTSTITNFTAGTTSGLNPTVSHNIITTTGTLTTGFTISGTPSEVEVNGDGDGVIIGLPDNVNITNDLVVGGNLTVQGTTTTLNTTELLVEDNIITLNSEVTGTPTANAGIEIERGTSTNTSIIWNEATDRWTFTNDGSTFYNIPIPSEYTAYVHPTQAAINVDGSDLQFVQDVTVNTLGHVTAVSLGTIPNASTTTIGVVRLTTNSETTGNTLATTPDTVAAMISAAISNSGASQVYKTTITPTNNSTTTINHNLGTTDIMVELFDTSTGETIWTDTKRVDNNNINIIVGNLGTVSSIRVLIRTV